MRDIAHRIYVVHAGEIVAEFENSSKHPVSRISLTQAMADMKETTETWGGVDE